MKKQCIGCGIIFETDNKLQKYCSIKCRDRSRKPKKYLLTCSNCGKQYERITKHRGKITTNFCCSKCSFEYAKKNNEVVKCVICNNEFIPTKQNHLCCSKKCRDIYTRLHTLKKCKECGKDFYSQKSTDFCSEECKKNFHQRAYGVGKCQYCGKDFYKHNEQQKFCSTKCKLKYYDKHVEYYEIECSQCHKIFKRNKKYISCQNELSFCSQKCKGIYYSDLYRENILKFLSEGKMPTSITKPHKIISEYLNDNKIEHINEFTENPYSIDIVLKDKHIAIEIMGSYWHGDIRKYKDFEELKEFQIKNIIRDSKKELYLKNNGYIIIYLWEKDIMQDLQKCEIIIQTVLNNIQIKTIHSSEYDLVDNNLIKNNIKQYMETDIINTMND